MVKERNMHVLGIKFRRLIILLFFILFLGTGLYGWNYMFFSGERNGWATNVLMDKQWGYQHWHIIYVATNTDGTNQFKFIGSDSGNFSNWNNDYGDDDTTIENTGDTADYQPAGDGNLEVSVDFGYAYIFSFDTINPHDKRYEVTKITDISLCGNYYVNWTPTNTYNLMTKDGTTNYIWRKTVWLTNGKTFYFKFVPNKSWSDPISTTNGWSFCDEDGTANDHYTNTDYNIKMNDATNIRFLPPETAKYKFYINLDTRKWRITKIPTSDTNAPNNVTNFSATLGNNSDITLHWSNPTNFDYAGVMIRYKTTGYPLNSNDGIFVTNILTPISNYRHFNLTNGKTYYYRAFAYDTANNYATNLSGATDSAGPVVDTVPPAPVTSFNLSPGDTQISISWINPVDPDFQGVKIVRRTNHYPVNLNDGVTIYSNSGTSTIDTGLTNGITYYYKIWAYDESYNYSTPVSNYNTPQEQPITKSIDGNLADWSNYERMETDGAKKFYISWNSTNLYFAWDSNDWGADGDMFIYFDTDPDGNQGTTTSVDWDGTYTLPDKFDWAFCIENNTWYDLRKYEASAWNIKKTINSNFCDAYIGYSGNGITEVQLPLSEIGSPTKLRILCFSKGDSDLTVLNSFPVVNPTGTVSAFTHYYNLPDLSYSRRPHTEASLPYPTGFTVTAGERKNVLNWQDNYSESDQAGYNIYRSTNTNTGFTKINSSPINGTNYIDTGLVPEVTYYYFIRGVLIDSYESSDSETKFATPYDSIGPDSPTGFTATPGPGIAITLSWNNPTNSDFVYTRVYKDTSAWPGPGYGGEVIYEGLQTTITDTNIVTGVTYYYQAFAYDSFSNHSISATNARDSASILDITPPNNVANFTATAGTNSDIILTWQNPTNTDYNGVEIRRKIGGYPTNKSDGVLVVNAAGGTTNYNDTGLTIGSNYYYRAFAYDTANNYATNLSGATDNAIPQDSVPPGSVINLTCSTGDNQITVYWQNPSDADWAGTLILRKTNGYSTNHNDGVLIYNGQSISFVDTNVINGTGYYYTGIAYDNSSNYSAVISESWDYCVPSDKIPPANISNFNTTTGTGVFMLSWVNPSDSDFQGVIIRWSTNSFPASVTDGQLLCDKTNSPGSSDSYIFINPVMNQKYYFTAFSYDEVPNYSSGKQKSYTFTYIDTYPPAAIQDLVVETGDNEGEVKIKFTAVGDNGNSGTASYYIIKYSLLEIVETASNTRQVSFDNATTFEQNVTPKSAGEKEYFVINNLDPGKKYYFRIKVVDKNGNKSDLSNLGEGVSYVRQMTKIYSVICAPNPCVVDEGGTYIYFKTDGFVNDIEIKIYNLFGEEIYTANNINLNTSGWNKYYWNLRDSQGNKVPNGVYIYVVKGFGIPAVKGKLTILRAVKGYLRPYYNPDDEHYGKDE